MSRFRLALAAGALAAALPAPAHAGGNYRVFTSRAAYLAAVDAGGGRSRPQITSGVRAVGTTSSGVIGDVTYSVESSDGTVTPLATGGVFDVQAGADSAGRFAFAGTAPPYIMDFPVGRTFGLGLSFTAATAGPLAFSAGGGIAGPQQRTFDLPAGGSGFFGYVFDVGAARLFTSIGLEAPAGARLTVTGIDVADAPTSTVPEPASVALVGAGLAGVGLAARRRARA